MELYGREWTRNKLMAHVGRIEQIGGIRRLQYAEGPAAGVECIQVRTGAGLEYEVLPSRGLDISLATFSGMPFVWQSVNGDVHPAYYDPNGTNWLRTATGGLLMTCGLTHTGPPCSDAGYDFGLHGRAHHLPARHVCAEGRWQDDEYEMRITGVIEDTAIVGECLQLRREIQSRLGENRISITDVVENIGFDPAPHMIMYHFNFGFPLLTPETEIDLPSQDIEPRDDLAPFTQYDRWQAPDAGFHEQVYFHQPRTEKDGRATAVIRNPHFPISGEKNGRPVEVKLSWDTRNLPLLVQWQMPSAGTHVLGLEPANCRPVGRATARRQGILPAIAPAETRTYSLELTIGCS